MSSSPVRANLIGTACYLLAAAAGFLVGGFSPGLPSVWPAAGIALALLLIWGIRCWPAVLLGAFAAYLHLWPHYSTTAALTSALLAMSATIQAIVGARLSRSYITGDVPLATHGAVSRFLLYGGPVACVGPAIVVAAIPPAYVPVEVFGATASWFGWWAGNSLGVLLFTPIALALWPGQHAFRRFWGWRVALPLLILAGLLAAGNTALDRIEKTEQQLTANRVKEHVHDSAFVRLPEALALLHSVERFFAASGQVTRAEFAVFTQLALRWPGLLTIEWVPRVTHAQRARFEADAQASGLTGYQIHDLDANQQAVRAPARAEYFPGHLVEPSAIGAANVGLDFGAIPARRAAMEHAARSARATAVGPVTLIQSGRLGIPVFVPVYRAGFNAAIATDSDRHAALTGHVQGLFDVATMFAPIATAAADGNLRYRVTDVTPDHEAHVIASSIASAASTDWHAQIEFAGRKLRLELASLEPYWLSGTSLSARAYHVFAIVIAFLAGLATLSASGRFAVTAAQVTARTAELHASERDLEVTLQSIGDAVLATDASGHVTRMNPVAELLTGWSANAARGRPIEEVFNIIDEQTRQSATIPVSRVLASGTIQGLANHTILIAKDGSECAIDDSAAPIHSPDGKVHGVVLTFRDVTAERAAAHALAASEQRYRDFIESIPFGVMVQSQGRFAFLNRKALTLLGAVSEQQLQGRPVLEFLDSEYHDAIQERMRDLDAARAVQPAFEARWRRLDGSRFHGESSAVPYVYEGQPAALVVLQDVTERKLAAVERDRFFELAVDMMFIIDKTGKFLRVNPAVSEVLQWTAAECADLSYQALVHPTQLEDTSIKDRQLVAGSRPLKGYEVQMRCKDGSYRWLSWNVAYHDDRFYAVASDMTERKKFIAQLMVARETAEQANKAKSAFLAVMSHEIRTPMNGVLGMVDILAYSRLSEHQADLVNTIRDSATTLLRVIDDILDFSKIEAGRLELEQTPVAVADLIEGVCNSLLPVAARRHVEMSLFVAPEIPAEVLTDDVRLRQIVYNLLGNAIKFSAGTADHPGRVRVRAEVAQSTPLRLRLSVVDNGVGMAPQTLDSLFHAFTQAEVSTTRRFGGTGLGLAICKRLIDLMGGTITVASTLGEGSEFVVTLPMDLPAEQPQQSQPDLANLDCIVVEHVDFNARDLQHYLAHAGARTVLVADLPGAVAAADALEEPVVVIQDLRNAPTEIGALLAAFENRRHVRHLLITRGRRRRGRIDAENVVTLDGDALRRLAFLRAVAVAAGRASPELFHDAPDELAIGEVTPPPTIEAARARNELILVAEDDAINQKVIRQQLALLGYAVEIAIDGVEALSLWRRGGHGLIFTDLHMPEMDGYTLATEIRRAEAGTRRIPIVALTANALRGEEWRALRAGMDAYLTKPAPLPLLREALQRWLPRAAETANRPIEASTAALPTTLNLDILRGLIGDDEAMVQEFLREYRVTLIRLVAEMPAVVSAEVDVDSVAMIAHKLKSSSRSVGALAFGEICAALERAGRAGSGALIETLLPKFHLMAKSLETELGFAIRDPLHE